jgi:hypothetical protein
MQVKAGTILVMTHGEYSDYSYTGPFRVVKDFDQAEIAETFRNAWAAVPREAWEKRPSEHEFIGWLSTEGFVEDVANSWEWYIGSYGFDPVIDSEADALEQTP